MGIMAIAADERVADVKVSRDTLSVSLRDGRTIIVPLAWYPRLLNATAAQRKNWRVAGGGYGIHWPDIDEDLSTEGLLRGAPAPRPAANKSRRQLAFARNKDARMDIEATSAEIHSLPIDERRRIAQAIWDGIAAEQVPFALNDATLAALADKLFTTLDDEEAGSS